MTLQLCDEPIYSIKEGKMSRNPLDVETKVWQWLGKMASNYNLKYCLGHTLDGIFWGLFDGHQLTIALTEGNSFISFDETSFFDLLCELRLFGKTAELHLWQQGTIWHATLTQDGTGDICDYMDDEQMLWGTQIETSQDTFTLMGDGVQGLYHAVPLASDKIPVAENGKHRPLRLNLRHYLAYDEMGCVYVVFSRLVAVTAVTQEVQNGA